MATELIPVVDLRLLSQEELNALSLSSPNAFDLRRCDDVVVPKIDRSVFNESAGSRKQTYSRLRLAPRKPDVAVARRRSRTLLPSTPAADDDPGRRENQQIVGFLRQLFAREDPTSALGPDPGPAHSQPQTLTLASLPTGSVTAEEASRALVSVEDRDKEVLNVKGVVVDVAGLGGKEDPFGEELRRRTEGMTKDEELLGFLRGLDGQWGSRRKKRKIVDAAAFGDDLPRGWKLLLGLRRKEGIARLDCRRYISPNGKQFVSCKEVAAYILSLVGYQATRQQISGQNDNGSPGLDKLTPGCAAGPTSQAKENPSCFSVSPISSISADQEKQSVLFRVEKQTMIEPNKVLECHKCNLTFSDKDTLVQHLLSFHQRSAKRRRLGKSIGDGVIVKDGKYECQFCHKIFSERHRYNGHIGAHVRYQGLSAEAFSDENITRKIINPTPLAAVPFSEMDVLTNKNEETSTAKSVDSLLVGSSSCRLEMENHEIDRNVKYGAPETSEIACTGKSVDNRINNCDATLDISEKIVETCNGTSIKSNACTDAISPSVIHINNTAHDCSPNISREASVSKPVDDQINDMNGCKFEDIIKNSTIKVIKPDECLNAISPLLPNVDNTPCKTVNTTSMSKPVGSLINDFDMDGSKSEVIVEGSSVKDVKPHECLNAIFPPLTNTDNATCETVNENGLRSSMSESIDGIDGCDMIGCKSEEMVDTSNAIGMEPNSCLDALSPSLINLDNMTCDTSNEIELSSCTIISGIEKYSEEQKVDSENDLLITSGNGSSYGVETYSNDVFTCTMEEQELVEMDISSNELKSDIGSCHILSDKDTIMENSMHDELHTRCITPVGSGHPGGVTNSADCTFHSDVKVSVFEEMNKLGNELENCLHSSNAEDGAGDGIENNGGNPLQVTVVNTSWVQSSDSLPILNMIPEQCEDELGGAGQKHRKISGFDEPRMGGSQTLELILLAGQESGSASEPTDELGYVAELENGNRPSIEPDWGMSVPKMVGGCGGELKAVCIWCDREIDGEGVSAELQSDMVGFVCPACKKISGQLDLSFNGLSPP